MGGRGSGKSFVGAYDLIRRSKPGRLYLVGAPTYKVLADASIRSFMQIARSLKILQRYNQTANIAYLANGAQVIFRSADNPESWRGPNLSGAWLDEGSQLDRDAYLVLIACLREGGELGWLTATFTPRGKHHWTYEVFGKGGPGVFLVHAKTNDNPFLPPTFEEEVRREYPAAMAAQELGGEFIDVEGAVFKAKNLRRYTSARGEYLLDDGTGVLKADVQIFATMDPACSEKTTADYTAIGIWGITTDPPRLFCLDMLRKRLDIEAIVPALEGLCNLWNPGWVAIEANGFQVAIARQARALGLPIRELHPDGKGKLVRATPAIVRSEAGQFFLPKAAPWLQDFEAELLSFTGQGEGHDDMCDTLFYATLELEKLVRVDYNDDDIVLCSGRRGI